MNCTIQDMLAKYVAEHQCDWDDQLPMVMMRTGPVFISLPNIHCITFWLDTRYDYPSMLCMVVSLISWKQHLSTWGTLDPLWKKPKRKLEKHEDCPEKTERLLWLSCCWRRDKGWRSCVPSCSCNQVWTDKEVAFPMMAWSICGSKEISDVTYRIEEVENRRKWRVVHFNWLKLCGEPQPDRPATWSAYWPAFQFTTAETSSSPSLCSGWDWSHVCRRDRSWQQQDLSKSWGRGFHRGRGASSRTNNWNSNSSCPPQTEKRSSRSCLDERLSFLIFEWTLINFLDLAAIRVNICYSACTPGDFNFALNPEVCLLLHGMWTFPLF